MGAFPSGELGNELSCKNFGVPGLILMKYNRWLVVLGALLVQPCLGAIYGWGVFVPALKATRSELTVMLSPKVLDVDPAVHAEVVAEHKRLKKRLAEAHASEREAAK